MRTSKPTGHWMRAPGGGTGTDMPRGYGCPQAGRGAGSSSQKTLTQTRALLLGSSVRPGLCAPGKGVRGNPAWGQTGQLRGCGCEAGAHGKACLSLTGGRRRWNTW